MAEASYPPTLFINRELSWLEFNARVLHEALDARTPLLERVKFLGIFSNNLDEFYMVRVAGLRRQVAANVQQTPPDGMSPRAQLDAIDTRVRELINQQRACLYGEILPALEANGIRLVRIDETTPEERGVLDDFFAQQVYPVLTPLAVDPGHPFPYISNLSLSLAVLLSDPERGGELFARVKVPKSLPRWVPIGRPNHFLPLEELIKAHLPSLFPGMVVSSSHAFRITRYSDFDVPAPDEPEDLLSMIGSRSFSGGSEKSCAWRCRKGCPSTCARCCWTSSAKGWTRSRCRWASGTSATAARSSTSRTCSRCRGSRSRRCATRPSLRSRRPRCATRSAPSST
jgi:polyphosphate kinase